MKKIYGKMITNFFEFAEPTDGNKTSEIQILQTGIWNHPSYGKMKITQETINEMIQHFEEQLRKGVYITEGHPQNDEELPAVGWVKSLIKKGSDSLYAVIEWTDKGMELLKSKSYKFFSPEFYFAYEDPETREKYNNVLTGGALTNRPYFKSLEAVVLSEKNLISNKNKEMDIEKIIAKEPSEINAEEKAFLISMKEDLDAETIKKFKLDEGGEETEEEKKAREEKEAAEKAEADKKAEEEKAAAEAKEKEEADAKAKAEEDAKAKDGGNDKEDDAEKQFSEKIKASEAKITALEKENSELKMKEKEAKIEGELSKVVFSEANKGGVILTKEMDKVKKFAQELSDDQVKVFFEILNTVPKANIFGELGSGKFKEEAETLPKGVDKESHELDLEAKKMMSENKELSYEKAVVMAEKKLKK